MTILPLINALLFLLSLPCIVHGGVSIRDTLSSGHLTDSLFLKQAEALNSRRSDDGLVSITQLGQSNLHELKELSPVVSRPVGVSPCQVYLLKGRVFQVSETFRGQYTVSKACGTSWQKVILTVNGQCSGLQYDALLTVFLDKLQILKLNTPISLYNNGTKWTAEFDVTKYSSYLKATRTVTAILPFTYSDNIPGLYNITAYLSFYAGAKSSLYPDTVLAVPSTTLIPSAFKLTKAKPSVTAQLGSIPRNAYRAILEVSVYPEGQDAFPYFSIPNKYAKAFPYITANKTIFHEVRALVDGRLAGTVWTKPFLSPFQGSLAFWAEIAPIGTVYLPTYFVDVTPLVGTLVDGKSHTVTFSILDISSSSTWQVASSLHLWLDPKLTQTSGKLVSASVGTASLKVSASFPATAFDLSEGNVLISGQTASSLSGFVVTSFGNLTTTVTSSKAFSHALKLRASGFVAQSSQSSSISNSAVTKDKAGKVWYSLTESLTLPFVFILEGEYSIYTSFDHGISVSRALLYAPGKQANLRIFNKQSGAGTDDELTSFGAVKQELKVSDKAKVCYTKVFEQGGFTYIYSDYTSNSYC